MASLIHLYTVIPPNNIEKTDFIKLIASLFPNLHHVLFIDNTCLVLSEDDEKLERLKHLSKVVEKRRIFGGTRRLKKFRSRP